MDLKPLQPPIVITPITNWSKISQKAMRFSYVLSHEVHAVHVSAGEETKNEFCKNWSRFAEAPAREAGLPPPQLVVLDSPYRTVLTLADSAVCPQGGKRESRGDMVAVVLAGNGGAALVSLFPA